MSAAVSARAQRARRRAAQSAPQPRRLPICAQSTARAHREIFSEHSSDDCCSEYELANTTKDSATFSTVAASHARPEAQAALSTAVRVAQAAANNEPCDPSPPRLRD